VDEQDAPRYSRAPEPADIVRICRALNEAGALYLLIGGFAVIAHGAGRFTKDIDLLVDDAPETTLLPRSPRATFGSMWSSGWLTRSWWT
jgi:hypothetical protein